MAAHGEHSCTSALVPAALIDPVVAFFNPRSIILFGSAEKLLKGFLVMAQQDFRKTHGLETLAEAVFSTSRRCTHC